MEKYVLIIISQLILFTFVAVGQPIGWSKHYDLHIGNDYATHVLPVADGAIIQATGFCDFNSRDCHALLKLDNHGELIWKSIIYDTLEFNGFSAFVVRSDTILINMAYLGTPGKACSVLSFDLEGNYLSRFDYEQNVPFGAGDLLLRPDGSLYVQFDIRHPLTNKLIEYTRCYDRNWNLLWDTHTPETGTLNRTKSIVSLDSGLVLCYTHWPGGGQNLKFHVKKFDKNGELQWHTQYPYGCDNANQHIKISAMPDGSYIGAFASDSFGLYAANIEMWFKLDAHGNRIWEKANLFEERVIYDSFISQSGNVIACGEMPDYLFDTIVEPELSAYVMCLNADGERLWERKILDKTSGVYRQYVYGGAELSNGDLMFAGAVWDTTASLTTPTFDDMWIFKTDSTGCFTPDCSEWQTLTPARELQTPEQARLFVLYPNPTMGECNLVATLGSVIPPGQFHIQLYDASGRFLLAQKIDPLFINRLDISNLDTGTYTATLFREGLRFQTLRLTKK
ncbi:MAG: T9SS type A sorting domain-containing protein [Saprospiraceae bacterium]|nr:T9SS type A sorting domain-containing protein [Saprospiraceae bacterium]